MNDKNIMYTAIFINAEKQIIDEIEISSNFTDISDAIGCEYFTIGARLDNNDVLYVDDMGLLKDIKYGFYWKGYLMVGNGLVVGCTHDGDVKDVESRIGQIEDIVKFLPPDIELNNYFKSKLGKTYIV